MLTVSNLQVEIDGLQILWDVNLKLEAGERVGLLGANGAGKSTTMAALLGMAKVNGGLIHLFEDDITNAATTRILAMGIGLVPEGRQLFPALSVEENLRMGCFLRAHRKAYRERLDYIYDLFPILKEKSRQMAGDLSGGQQQMVAIGRAMMGQPRLLLLDEPFIGVAPIVVMTVLDVLRRIASNGVTVLLVEQNVHRALEFVDRAYVIDNGRTVHEGRSEELLNDGAFAEKFLGLE
ncbi:MAG: branched-chain amino acid ABC transporter ATP-binding protein [Ahrensia sp.]|nr:branched-chain amino acid ABC transporter ATP-binding protein [Ahrensia sp.]